VAVKSFKKKISIIISVSLGIVAVAVIALIITTIDLGKVSKEIQEKRLEAITQQRAVGALASLRADSKKATELFPRLEKAMTVRDELLTFRPEMQGLGTKNKAPLTITFGPETGRKEDEPGSIQFTIIAQGAYGNLIELIRDIEKSRYFTSLDNFDIVRQNEESLNLTLTGKVFFR